MFNDSFTENKNPYKKLTEHVHHDQWDVQQLIWIMSVQEVSNFVPIIQLQ